MNEKQPNWISAITWILLIIAIILSATWTFKIPEVEQCLFQQGFECEGGVMQIYVDDSNNLFVAGTIHSKESENLYNIKVLCTSTGKGNVNSDLFSSAESEGNIPIFIESVDSKGSFEITGVPCVDLNGNELKSNEGASVKGLLVIEYTPESNLSSREIEIASLQGIVVIG